MTLQHFLCSNQQYFYSLSPPWFVIYFLQIARYVTHCFPLSLPLYEFSIFQATFLILPHHTFYKFSLSHTDSKFYLKLLLFIITLRSSLVMSIQMTITLCSRKSTQYNYIEKSGICCSWSNRQTQLRNAPALITDVHRPLIIACVYTSIDAPIRSFQLYGYIFFF